MTEDSGDKLERKKLRDKSKRKRECESNGGDVSAVEYRQGKKMKLEKVASKENSRIEDKVDDLDKKMEKKKKKLSDKSKSKDGEFNSNEGDPSLASVEAGDAKACASDAEVDDQRKKKKKKKKLSDKSKSEDGGFNSNEGDPSLASVEAGDAKACGSDAEVDDQRKKKKNKKKLIDKSKSKDGEFNSNEGDPSLTSVEEGDAKASGVVTEVDDQSKKKKKKKLSDKSKSKDREFNNNEGDPSLTSVEEGDVKACGVVTEVDDQSKKKKKKKLSDKSKSKDREFNNNEGDPSLTSVEEGDVKACGVVTEVDDQSKKKKKKKKLSDKSKSENGEFNSNEGDPSLASVEAGDSKACGVGTEVDDQSKNKKKKKKLSDKSEFNSNEGGPSLARVEAGDAEVDDQSKKKKSKARTGESTNPAAHDGTSKPKRVTFSDQVEVCSDSSMRFRRFTPEEDEKIKEAVSDYVESHGLRDVYSVFNSSSRPQSEVKGCRKEIGAVLPYREIASVFHRARYLFVERERRRLMKPKRVTSEEDEGCCDSLVRGKRFTPEEDEKIKEAVYDYIESHDLGDEGLNLVLYSRSSEVKGCWKEIAAALPRRHYLSVSYRAHVLFERGVDRWTPEEHEFLRQFHAQHGADWKSAAEALGKSRIHVKDAWRRIKNTNLKKGRWTQDEYQKLFELVNKDLRARAGEVNRKSHHGMLRDNISWEAISDKLVSRTGPVCCTKWYSQLVSPLVADGVWCDTDDYRMLDALYTLDACSMEEVDWDNLVENRSGDVSRKRWYQMVQNIGEHGAKSFAEQVEILAKRYRPELLEAREAFDSKPVVCCLGSGRNSCKEISP